MSWGLFLRRGRAGLKYEDIDELCATRALSCLLNNHHLIIN